MDHAIYFTGGGGVKKKLSFTGGVVKNIAILGGDFKVTIKQEDV